MRDSNETSTCQSPNSFDSARGTECHSSDGVDARSGAGDPEPHPVMGAWFRDSQFAVASDLIRAESAR